jgi:hypothetical protein
MLYKSEITSCIISWEYINNFFSDTNRVRWYCSENGHVLLLIVCSLRKRGRGYKHEELCKILILWQAPPLAEFPEGEDPGHLPTVDSSRCPALLIFHCAALGQCKNIRVEIYCAILWQTEIPGSSALASSDLLSVGLMCVSTFWTTCVYDICGWFAQSWDVSCTPNSFVWFFFTPLAFVVYNAQRLEQKGM